MFYIHMSNGEEIRAFGEVKDFLKKIEFNPQKTYFTVNCASFAGNQIQSYENTFNLGNFEFFCGGLYIADYSIHINKCHISNIREVTDTHIGDEVMLDGYLLSKGFKRGIDGHILFLGGGEK